MTIPPKMLEFFCRHLVGLAWYEGFVNEAGEFTSRPTFFSASGFLLLPHEATPYCCLVTAGHVYRDHADRMKQQRGLHTTSPSLFDIWGPNAKCKERIPFDFFEAPVDGDCDDGEGVDYAVVALPDHIQSMLLQTTIPVTKENWIHQSKLDFDDYAIIGLPNDLAEQFEDIERGRRSVTTYQNPRMLFLKPCAPPPSAKRSRQSRFFARIDSDERVLNIEGMSGGPIFGFRKRPGEQMAYWPIAIQSGWFKPSQIVAASYLAPIAAKIEANIQSLLDSQSD